MAARWPSVLVVGCGSMGGALMHSLVAAGCPPASLCGIEQSERRCALLRRQLRCAMRASVSADMDADVVILAVKPQQASEVLAQLRGSLAARTVLVSIMAGIDLSRLRLEAGHALVVRAMPNLPVIVQSGATALAAGADLPAATRDLVFRVFAASGTVVWLQSEADMDIVTAVSGSGPAYFFYLMECLENSAVAMGLDAAAARALVLHTALGAARLAVADDADSPAALRARVTSPGGTTEAAVRQLDSARLAAAIETAVTAARDRSVQLRKPADG